jgi:hypothetical protein
MSGPQAITAVVAGAEPVTFWVTMLFVTVFGVWLVRRGTKDFWRLRLIADTPTARIRSAPQGYVEVQGLAQPRRETLAARLTGKPCVWFRWSVEQYKRGSRSGHWVTIDGGDAGVPFLVDDGTGEAEVEPTGAYLHLRSLERWEGSRPAAVLPVGGNAITNFFERHRQYRMTEERIVANEPVYILGRFETPRRGVRERDALARTLLSRWKRDPERMRTFDRDGDGDIDLHEWEEARRHAARLAEQSEARLSEEPPRPRIGDTADPAQPFVVSTVDEQSLLRRLRLSAYGGTLLGLLIGLFTVAVFLERLAA